MDICMISTGLIFSAKISKIKSCKTCAEEVLLIYELWSTRGSLSGG